MRISMESEVDLIAWDHDIRAVKSLGSEYNFGFI